MEPPSPPAPPTERPDVSTDDATRLQRLERRVKWLMGGLAMCLLLVVGLGGFTAWLLEEHAQALAREAARETAQLRLLQQIREDFHAFEHELPRNRVEAYGQLREHLDTLRDVYGAMGEFDLSDPDAALDKLFEDVDPSSGRRPTGDMDRDVPPAGAQDEPPPG